MVILGVFLYLSLVALLLALLCLPAWRDAVRGGLWRAAVGVSAVVGRAARGGAGQVQAVTRPLRAVGQDLGARVQPLRWWWTGALALLMLAPGTALWVRQQQAYDGYDHTISRESNRQIEALLQGEQLVPPPRLPPELFITREVEQFHPLAATASRQWELLDAEFRQRLLTAYRLMREQHGYEMVLIEGWRSPERQDQLASLGPQVTHAAAGQSFHQYGLAADSAFLRDGRIVISERDPWAAQGYQHFGAIAQSVGLTWGGAWRGLADLGHVELTRAGVLKRPG